VEFLFSSALVSASRFRRGPCLSKTGLFAGPAAAQFTDSTNLNFEHSFRLYAKTSGRRDRI